MKTWGFFILQALNASKHILFHKAIRLKELSLSFHNIKRSFNPKSILAIAKRIGNSTRGPSIMAR